MTVKSILDAHGSYNEGLEIELLRFWNDVYRADHSKWWVESAIVFVRDLLESQEGVTGEGVLRALADKMVGDYEHRGMIRSSWPNHATEKTRQEKTMSTTEINGEMCKRVTDVSSIGGDFTVWEIGETYHIETYTKYFTGRVIGETETHILLNEACYIASTGRFMEYVAGSDPSEAEPYPRATVVRIRKDAEVSSIKRELVLEQISGSRSWSWYRD